MRKRKQHNWGGDDCPMWTRYNSHLINIRNLTFDSRIFYTLIDFRYFLLEAVRFD